MTVALGNRPSEGRPTGLGTINALGSSDPLCRVSRPTGKCPLPVSAPGHLFIDDTRELLHPKLDHSHRHPQTPDSPVEEQF
jgi:hypothetical protein